MIDTALRIDLARPSDLAETDALFARSYPVLLKPDYPPSVLVTALPIISRAQPKLLASGTFYVARLDGAIVGAGGWTPGAPGGARSQRAVGHIRHVVTDHDHTRRGIGRAIMSKIFATAAAARMSELHCQATITAVPFYRSVGFLDLREIVVPLRPGIEFPAVAMTRSL